MRTGRICPTAVLALVLLVAFGAYAYFDPNPAFRRAVVGADEIRVRGRGGGDGYLASANGNWVFARVTDPAIIRSVRRRLSFMLFPTQQCNCTGYPAIDWYRGGKRIASFQVHNNERVRPEGSSSDLLLTTRSREWLAGWLKDLGVPAQDEYEDILEARRNDLGEFIKPLLDKSEVDLAGVEAEDYNPLRRLRRVRTLSLTGSTITDLSPVSGLLTLEELNLGHTQVSDVSPLANLRNLEVLRLHKTKVTGIRPLGSLPKLRYLAIRYSPGMDLSPLTRMKTLSKLYLGGVAKGSGIVAELRSMLPGCAVNE